MERFYSEDARAIPCSSDVLSCIDRLHTRTRSSRHCVHVRLIGAMAVHRSLQIDERLR